MTQINATAKDVARAFGLDPNAEITVSLPYGSAWKDIVLIVRGTLLSTEAFEVPACPLGCTEHEVCASLRKDK